MKQKFYRRLTKQRNTILEELSKVKTHPTAESIFRMVKRRLPNISFGTVYRNLNLLRDEGSILELVCGKYSCHYDANINSHYHLFCLKCKRIFDLGKAVLKKLDRQVSQQAGVTVKYHRLDFYGYCKNCKH